MDLNNSKKLSFFKKEYFDYSRKHVLFENVLKTNGKIVFGRGSDEPKIVFIGEAPGWEENKQGLSFVGRSGKLLDSWINFLKLREKDYSIINVVPIIPLDENNNIRKPSVEEIKYFFPKTIEFLELLKPKIIILLGKSASSIFDKNLVLGQIKNWKQYNLFFIYHPSYYLRRGKKGFEDTLKKLKCFLKKFL